MVRIIIVNGLPRSGKDTFATLAMNSYSGGVTVLHSTVDTVKKAAKFFGADESVFKGPKERRLWSDLKDAYTRYCDGPFQEIVDKAVEMDRSNSDPLIFTMVREPEEIRKLKQWFGSRSITVLVNRQSDEEISNHADARVFECEYDVVIDNNGTLDDLRDKAKEFVTNLLQ